MSKYNKRGETGQNYEASDMNDKWVDGDFAFDDSPSINKLLGSDKQIPKKQKIYWTSETEDAIKNYLYLDEDFLIAKLEKAYAGKNDEEIKRLENFLLEATTDQSIAKKNKLFKDKINKPINRLIENIIFNFKLFVPGMDIKTQIHQCLSFLHTKFCNFDPDIHNKAFSFFGTITKHYLINEKKEFSKYVVNNVDYDCFNDEANSVETVELHKDLDIEESMKFFLYIIEVLQKEVEKKNMSQNDIKVVDAIIQIFQLHEYVGHYSKNLLYQDIKEATGLQTKDITYSLSRLKNTYRTHKQSYLNQKNK